MNPPYATGQIHSRLAFIGEAPAREEVKRGKCFQGPAGKQHTSICASAGLNRESCYHTNLFKYRLPKDSIALIFDARILSKQYSSYDTFLAAVLAEKVGANPEAAAAIKEALVDLKTEFEDFPKNGLIIAYGDAVTFALTGVHGISKWRGSLLYSPLLERWIMPTYHPAYFLPFHSPVSKFHRNPDAKIHTVIDVKNALSYLHEGNVRPPKREYLLEPKFEEAMEYIAMCKKKGLAGFDIEVYNKHVSCFSLSPNTWSAISIPLLIKAGHSYFPEDQEVQVIQALGNLLEDPNVKIVMQNAMFDTFFMYKEYGFLANNIDDSMIAQWTMTSDLPKGLDYLTSIFCHGEPYYKEERKIWTREEKDIKRFWLYNAKDAVTCVQAMLTLKQQMSQKPEYLKVYNDRLKLLQPLMHMQERGIRVCPALIKLYSMEQETRLVGLKKELNEVVRHPLNANSHDQVTKYFYIDKNVPPYRKKGKVTVDEKAMIRLARPNRHRAGFREAQIILDIRQATKGQFHIKHDKDFRLRTSFNPVGTTSGRLSSSKTIFGNGANMQNLGKGRYDSSGNIVIPSERSVLIVDRGYIGFRIDLGQAENRIVAYIARENMMMDAFDQDKDIHRQTGELIASMAPDLRDEEFLRQLSFWRKDVAYTTREMGKQANHAFNYGMGYRKFSLDYQVEECVGKMIYTGYHTAYPCIHLWQERIKRSLSQSRILRDLYGKPRYFSQSWGDGLFKEAYDYIPQSTVATKMLFEGVCFVYYNTDLFPQVDLLNTVHDDMWMQFPIELGADEIARQVWTIKENLEQPLQAEGRTFVIPADISAGYNFGGMEELPTNVTNAEGLAGWLSDVHAVY